MRQGILLSAFALSAVLAISPPHKRQTDSDFWTFWTSTTSGTHHALPRTTAAGSSDPLFDRVAQLCQPNYYKAQVADIDDPRYWDAFWPTLADSPFPCEQALYLQWTCTRLTQAADDLDDSADTHASKVTLIEAERACLCPSTMWEMTAACANCNTIRGMPTALTDYWLAQNIAQEKLFCNTTLPGSVFNWLAYMPELRALEHPVLSTTTTLDDRAPGKTEVGFYYTPGAKPPTLSEGWEPENTGTQRIDWEKFTKEPWTRATSFAFTGSTVPAHLRASSTSDSTSSPTSSATTDPTVSTVASQTASSGTAVAASTAGAAAGHDVKAAGGVLVGILGAMLML